MTEKNREGMAELYTRVSPTPPAVESFSSLAKADATWPKHIARNKEFVSQLELRKKLNEQLDVVISNLPRPDMPLQEAISQNHLTENQVTDLYTSLSSLLEDTDYQRIVLYLPFEFLPNTAWKPSSSELQRAAERFRAAYMSAWNDSLVMHDVRANFMNGDVLEVESRTEDLPRVVKAAHLIPKLIENGFLSIEDVFELMEESDDKTLKRSIADALPVLADLGFIHEAELARMQASGDSFIRDKAALVASSTDKTNKQDALEIKYITLPLIRRQLNDDFELIDAEKYNGITKKREAWLRQEKKQKAIESAGDDIEAAIIHGELSDEAVTEFVTPEASPVSQQALIDGIRKAIESAARTDKQQAQALYEKYRETLFSLLSKCYIPEIRDALSKTFSRLHGLDIISTEQLHALGLTIPALAGPFSENLNGMKRELDDIKNITASIEKDTEISQYIYPVALVFGSRLKGYGAQTADIDVGVFVKPGVSIDDMKKLQALLKKTFAHGKIQDEVVEFWLEETKDGLGVRDFEKPETLTGDSWWTHILFGAAWEGNKDAINKLHEKLLAPYLYDDKEKMAHGREARGLYLEELERDTLQYRLMHKGYERFRPPYGGIRTPHADLIDGKSMFWNSGYRQTATKLFADRVFLPKISRPEA